MPPKSRRKRRANDALEDGDKAHSPTLPSCETWPGWVEMESEPALFNIMLKEMGVRGVKVQEVYDMQDNMLAFLPQPVHALIFLFQFSPVDVADTQPSTSHDHIWFGRQIPEFACATVALLNIVNNVPGLTMGPEMRQFRDFTDDMDSFQRGEAINEFAFVRRIHNSFARENDLLTADVHEKNKLEKAKRAVASAKARATKRAREQAARAQLEGREPDFRSDLDLQGSALSTSTFAPTRSSARLTLSNGKATTPPSTLPAASPEPVDGPPGSSFPPLSSPQSSPLSSPLSSPDIALLAQMGSPGAGENFPVRRSTRNRKKRVETGADETNDVDEAATAPPASGYHFVAYMPIDDHVWKLDGLHNDPQDLGTFDIDFEAGPTGMSAWLRVAQPAISGRMAQFEGASIQFNVMAVVHDPAIKDKEALVQNVKALQVVGEKLTGIASDWIEMQDAETGEDVITSTSSELGIEQSDIDRTVLNASVVASIEEEEDFLNLILLRKKMMSQQAILRGSVRDALAVSEADDQKARHRRHDYSSFVRAWLGALADEGLLTDLVEES